MISLLIISGACGVTKKTGATDPQAQLGGFATVSQCPSFLGVEPPYPGYQGQVEPLVQRSCTLCHGPGGQGGGKLLLVAGDASDNEISATNFYALRESAVPRAGGAEAADPDGSSPLLRRLNGRLTHSLVFNMGSDEYAAVRDWVAQELEKPCNIDPSTGVVTVGH